MKRGEQVAGLAITHMCEDVLLQVFSLLSARDLAALSLQGRYLRKVASDSLLWRPLALARWPGADADKQYSGDWHALYMSRAQQPTSFPLAADRVRAVTAAQQRRLQQGQGQEQQAAALAAPASSQGEGAAATAAAAAAAACSSVGQGAGGSSGAGPLPALAFEEVMRQTFTAGQACSGHRSLKRTAEWRGLKADLTWWGTQQPAVVVSFIRAAHELLAGGGGASLWRGWSDAQWRRSAVAFVQDLGLLSGAHPSVADRVSAEVAAMDAAIRAAQRQAGSAAAAVAAPKGIPASHWWFH